MLSREETVAAYKAADLFLFPSQIECSPIVLFEAMASETAFLSSDAGNAKEIVEWSHGGEIMPTVIDAEGFSRVKIAKATAQLNQLVKDDKKRKQLAFNGFTAWEKNFSWEIITKRYEEMYLNLLTEHTK